MTDREQTQLDEWARICDAKHRPINERLDRIAADSGEVPALKARVDAVTELARDTNQEVKQINQNLTALMVTTGELKTRMETVPAQPLLVQKLDDRIHIHSLDLKAMREDRRNTIGRTWAVIMVLLASLTSGIFAALSIRQWPSPTVVQIPQIPQTPQTPQTPQSVGANP